MRAILTPLDGSRLAEESLRAACTTARRAGAVLHMVLVHHPVAPSTDSAAMATAFDELDRLAREGEERYLDDVANRMRAQHGVHVETAILDGPVAETLEAHVATVGAGMVVMTTHGRGVVSRFWLGSVADHLLRHLEVPILLLRHHEPAAVDSRMAFRRMLVPLDGSERAEAVLEPALALCPPPTGEFALVRIVGTDAEGTAQSRGTAAVYLDEVADRLERRGCRVSTTVLVSASPAEAILEQARPEATDCIAMATRGASGVRRLVLGSVTDKVVRGADVPVLALHPPWVDG
ncbi:MAG TPA: universal stress protein [Gemmatimonadales bacterium]|nr:universal stress protein [Gemmatimonadales bacterium]